MAEWARLHKFVLTGAKNTKMSIWDQAEKAGLV
jgi:hypothetical protein